eukprot:3866592-Pleurochrysis_carterae.AAC.1
MEKLFQQLRAHKKFPSKKKFPGLVRWWETTLRGEADFHARMRKNDTLRSQYNKLYLIVTWTNKFDELDRFIEKNGRRPC